MLPHGLVKLNRYGDLIRCSGVRFADDADQPGSNVALVRDADTATQRISAKPTTRRHVIPAQSKAVSYRR